MNSKLVEKYIPFVRELANKYQYPMNITHLLYLIVPAFISNYSLSKEQFILSIFGHTKIILSSRKDKNIEAYYTSIPSYQEKKIVTNKYIVIQNYENISLVQLLDNLVHEFNHAIHSYHQEIKMENDILYLRTGLTYASYSLPDLVPLKKDSAYILEEILNTNQTEQIINLIKSYQDSSNLEISHTVYAINSETTSYYQSKSYYLEHLLFQKILENKTFVSTLNNLRMVGNVEDIGDWFDHITGIPSSYERLNGYLQNIMNLEQKLALDKHFKGIVIWKIKRNMRFVLDIIHTFNQNCNYK